MLMVLVLGSLALSAACTPEPEIVEVIKEVKVEVEVEKEVVRVVGVQKGIPSVVSAVPGVLKEAPSLTERVKAGQLPPLADRLPKEPLVVQPAHEVGTYGGTIVMGMGFTPNVGGFMNSSLNYHDENSIPIPWVAKDFEVSADRKTMTFHLREGMKWSDGEPLTANDIMFWFEDILSNEDLTPTPSSWFKSSVGDVNPGAWTKIDDFTVSVTFENPYPVFLSIIGSIRVGGHMVQGGALTDVITPRHYMEKFHPKYAGQDVVDKLAKDEGFENWQQLFRAKNNPQTNIEAPVLTPWMFTVPSGEERPIMVRNPYYFAVDTEGNQLPYIDQVEWEKATDPEVMYLRTAEGRYHFQQIDEMQRYPYLLDNASKGNYGVRLWDFPDGSGSGWIWNTTYDKDPEIGKWVANKDFRIALSHSFDREELNEIFFLGLGEPGQSNPQTGIYGTGREYVRKYTRFDPVSANEILDGLGLTKKDSEGFRVRTDNGERLVIPLQVRTGEVDHVGLSENIAEQMARNIGIKIFVDVVEPNSFWGAHTTNEIAVYVWALGSTLTPMLSPHSTVPFNPAHSWAIKYAQYYATGGKEGIKPPAGSTAAKNQALFDRAKGMTIEEGAPLMKEALRNVADEMLLMGTVVNVQGGALAMFVVSNDLGNVAESGTLTAVHSARRPPSMSFPSQWYLK
jgi:peptide/nickel transport system substrate-binding protein